MIIRYSTPHTWIKYDGSSLVRELTEAKASILSLTTVPFQRSWAEALQDIQLKVEVAGTSRIEGASFTEGELEAAIASDAPEELMTRSQRQARAAANTYRWISALPADRPIDASLITEIHRRIVTGCDDDHCPPGELRGDGYNVVFGSPSHRGAEGGQECCQAFESLMEALRTEFREHDPLIQAFALHYHFGSMHPFLDGNGRTARAVEALMLQRMGLRDTLFIALSNYYYDEKPIYLKSLSSVRQANHDLTEFLRFCLRGITVQCKRLMDVINNNIRKALFRDMMNDLFGRLVSPRKRVLAKRQLTILNYLLNIDRIELMKLYSALEVHYIKLNKPLDAFMRDLNNLIALRAVGVDRLKEKSGSKPKFQLFARLDWPTQISETDFFKRIDELSTAKTYQFLKKDLAVSAGKEADMFAIDL